MPKLRHTTACSECPWRRVHPAGWLGGYAPEDFIHQVHRDGPPLPCHRTIPPGESYPDMDSDKISMCAGALIHMKNSIKAADHPDYGDALDHVQADPLTVFSWPHEFIAYHRDLDGWVKAVAARMKGARDPLADDDADPLADPLDGDDDADLAAMRAYADRYLKRRAGE